MKGSAEIVDVDSKNSRNTCLQALIHEHQEMEILFLMNLSNSDSPSWILSKERNYIVNYFKINQNVNKLIVHCLQLWGLNEWIELGLIV